MFASAHCCLGRCIIRHSLVESHAAHATLLASEPQRQSRACDTHLLPHASLLQPFDTYLEYHHTELTPGQPAMSSAMTSQGVVSHPLDEQ